uniref:Putative calcineurin-like phosphoesterase n=1 Tax=viral metagenome TaxID=1070528 RepID=A0A6M3L8T7_9ZZZZ
MQVIAIDIPEDHGYLIPVGDLHRGDRHLTQRGLDKLKGYLEWVKERANAIVFLMGDVLNVASRDSKSNPFESQSGDDEYAKSVQLFKPYARQIVGCITGNHEQRMYRQFGFNPLQPFCNELGIQYCGFSAVLKIRIGKRADRANEYEQTYWGFAHHGNGGGSTLGGALNRKTKLQEVVHGMDFYMAGHDHNLIVGTRNILLPKRDKIVHQRVHFIDTGSFLDWDGSYAEEAAFHISKQGAPRLRFDGRKRQHDLHVSI